MELLAILGFTLIAAIAVVISWQRDKSSFDPKNLNFANLENLENKLGSRADRSGTYTLEIIRQSSHVQRTLSNLTYDQAVKEILQCMRRAKIDTVSIRQSKNNYILERTMHHGRGVKEGKRIGGFVLIPEQQKLMRIDTINEAQKAILKSYINVYQQFSEDYQVKEISESFDANTGEVFVTIEAREVFNFLLIANAHLIGVGELTEDARAQFANSNIKWQRDIGADFSRTSVIGAETFGDTDLKSIQIEMQKWWDEAEIMLFLDKNKLETPSFLTMEF